MQRTLDDMIVQTERKIKSGQLSPFGMCMAMSLLKDLCDDGKVSHRVRSTRSRKCVAVTATTTIGDIMPPTERAVDKRNKVMPPAEIEMIRCMVDACADTYMHVSKKYMARICTSHERLAEERDAQSESITFAAEQLIELHDEFEATKRELNDAHRNIENLRSLTEETRQQFSDILQLDLPMKQDYSKTDIITALDRAEHQALDQAKIEGIAPELTYAMLKAQNAVMRDALEHCIKIFRSQADRGRYPLELMPFGPTVNEPNPHYLGRQGWMFILTALGQNDPF